MMAWVLLAFDLINKKIALLETRLDGFFLNERVRDFAYSIDIEEKGTTLLEETKKKKQKEGGAKPKAILLLTKPLNFLGLLLYHVLDDETTLSHFSTLRLYTLPCPLLRTRTSTLTTHTKLEMSFIRTIGHL